MELFFLSVSVIIMDYGVCFTLNSAFWRRAYDRAAIKFRGVDADINFDVSDYEDDLKQVGYWWYNVFMSECMRFFDMDL